MPSQAKIKRLVKGCFFILRFQRGSWTMMRLRLLQMSASLNSLWVLIDTSLKN